MYGYIYKTTFPNDMIYIGQKKGNKVDNSYYGSGSAVSVKIKEVGKQNLKRDILEWCETAEELNDREKYWINKLNSTNPAIGYNLSIGGEHRSLGCKFSKEAKEKMSAWQKGKSKPKEACENMKKAHQQWLKNTSPEELKTRAIKAAETRKNWSEERKLEYSRNLSNGIKGRVVSESEKLHHSEALKGRPKTEEHKKKIAIVKSRSIFIYNNVTFYTIKDLITHLNKTENINISEYKLRRIINSENKKCTEYPTLKYEIKEIKKL